MRRISLAGVGLALLVGVGGVSPGGVAAQTEEILPLGDEAQLGCVVRASGNLITRKGERGRNVRVAPHDAARILKARRSELRRTLVAASKAKDRAAVRAAKVGLRRLARTATDVRRCATNRLIALRRKPISFLFLCRHGFRAPSASATGMDCAIDMRAALPAVEPLSTKLAPGATALTPGVIRILDAALLGACEREGGTYLRNLNLDFYPLYHGGCQRPGTTLPLDQTEQRDVIVILGMETENPDCFTVAFQTPAEVASAKDPCDCYDPDAPRGGGGGGDPRPAPKEPDCVILQMDTDNPDC